MEDRITPVLYLEMTDRPAARIRAARVPEVLALPGVQRATWWANCVPFREDLPRTLPEFAVLGVYEADRDFEAPKGAGSVPDDITGYCFDHYGRPGQGTLSDKPTLGIELVLISAPTAEQSQTLRDWSDFIHIRDIAAASPPHFTMITPYENRAEGCRPPRSMSTKATRSLTMKRDVRHHGRCRPGAHGVGIGRTRARTTRDPTRGIIRRELVKAGARRSMQR